MAFVQSAIAETRVRLIDDRQRDRPDNIDQTGIEVYDRCSASRTTD